MTFGFGVPNLRSFDLGDAFNLLRLILDVAKFANANWPAISTFLRRNHRVMFSIAMTAMVSFVAGAFIIGSAQIAVGQIQMHIAVAGMVAISATGFSVCAAMGAKATREEWQRRPTPAPVGSD